MTVRLLKHNIFTFHWQLEKENLENQEIFTCINYYYYINDRRKLRHAANAPSQPLHDNSVALLDVHNKTSAKTNLESL